MRGCSFNSRAANVVDVHFECRTRRVETDGKCTKSRTCNVLGKYTKDSVECQQGKIGSSSGKGSLWDVSTRRGKIACQPIYGTMSRHDHRRRTTKGMILTALRIHVTSD